MKKNEIITFLILSFNFIVSGMIIQRPSLLQNDILFIAVALTAAYLITKYVFHISKSMNKKEENKK